jgi:plasmid rolling circle replication initiator protein Rep
VATSATEGSTGQPESSSPDGRDGWTAPISKTYTLLRDVSPNDKPWDEHREHAQVVEHLYEGAYDQLAERMHQCTGYLGFGRETDPETGEVKLKLLAARFCRVRHCPVCQWRRSLMWKARLLKALPSIEQAHPTARWIFLTLTVRNCELSELRSTLKHMNAAWKKLTKRDEFNKAVLGWIRTTEVTRGRDRTAHPHFHVLMMVKPSYFTRLYVKHARWAALWKECAQLDYTPIVDVRVVRDRRRNGEPLHGAVAETLKYAVKPEDLMDRDWLLELTRQVYKMRFIASGGVLKEVLRETEEEKDEDLLLLGEDGHCSEPEFYFFWNRVIRRYVAPHP